MMKIKKFYCLVFLFFLPVFTFAQEREVKIKGTVVDERTGEAVIGASISVSGSRNGTVTDIDGHFSLEVASLPVTVSIDYLGYKKQEVDVYESTEPLTVVLSENRNVLDEVVVVGYTTVKKSSYTGSVAVVGPKELEKLQVTTVGKALQGTVPGLQSIASAGQPGSDASLFIRGIGSVNASTSPLYVVDGIPGASVNNISGKDIQSISVLKDATASALYGSRGANGVIVITTKSGNLNSKAAVNFSASYGYTGRAVRDYDYLTLPEYHELQWEAIRNTQVDQGKTAAEAAEYASANLVDALKVNIYGPNYPVPVGVDGKLTTGATPLWNDDWGKAISRQGVRQQYDLNISGGSDNTKYFFSGGYLNENGWIITSEYERYHLRTSVQSKINSWFEAGANISASSSYQKSPMQEDSNTGNYANFQRLVSNIYPVYERNFEDGSFVLDKSANRKYDYGVWRPSTAAAGSNIPGSAAHSIFGSKSDVVSARTNFNITFLKGLLWKTTAAVDYSAGSSHSYSHSWYSAGVITEGAGSASRSSSRDLRYTVNSFIDYSLNLNNTHSFNFLAGPEIYVSNSSSLSGSRSGFRILGKTEPSAGTTSGTFSGTSSDYHLASWLGKFDYDFLHRYYFSASIRRDGSSRFSKQSRWGNFWSAGASWNVKSEDFLRDMDDINNLNLRLSYGAQGNDNVGNYAYGGFYSIYNSLDQLGLLPSDLPTPNLKWETNLNFNFGVDIALFGNRLIAQIDLYNRQSKNLLFTKPLAPSSGYSGINANIGSLSNRGIDGQLTGTPVLNRNFKWDIALNFGHYTNKITKLPQKEIISGNKRMAEGSSVYDFWIKEWAGVNPENGKALWYKNITDENGNVTERTTTENQSEATFDYHGSSLPDIYGGLSNTFSYKGLELSFLISYSIGGYIYDGDYVWVMHSGYSPGRNWSKEALTRWTPENRDTDFPRLSYISDTWNTTVSTRFLYSATYARLKQFGFSYQLPRKLISAWNLKNVKLGVNGENLLTFFGHQGLDPEQTVSGSTYYRYPAQKAVSFTLDISF